MQNLYCATDKAQTADIEGSIAVHFGENPLGTLTMVVKASSPPYILSFLESNICSVANFRSDKFPAY